MIKFYHGTQIPGEGAGEGIYFVQLTEENSISYSIYIKDGTTLRKYGEVNEVTAQTIADLWEQIDNQFVQKTFTVAGLSLDTNITVNHLQSALLLQNLAYKNSAEGTINCVTEVEGVNYTPVGEVKVELGYDSTTISSTGTFKPEGDINGTVTSVGSVAIVEDASGTQITGEVSAPTITIVPQTEKVQQISNVGSLPSYQPAIYIPPSVNETIAPFATEALTGEVKGTVLSLQKAPTATAITATGFNAGEYTQAEFNPGSLPTVANSKTVMTGIISATASQPTFTGGKYGAIYEGTEQNIDATFTGKTQDIGVTGQYDKAKVNKAEFIGAPEIITPVLKREDMTIVVS